jgi:DNA-binding transcriptional ArsR family regulator
MIHTPFVRLIEKETRFKSTFSLGRRPSHRSHSSRLFVSTSATVAHNSPNERARVHPAFIALTCKPRLAYLIGKTSLAYIPMERLNTDALFRALADPARRKLLDQLNAADGQTLSQLCVHLDMTRQGVTQHLNVLEDADLVVTEWRGREKLHFLNPVPLQEIYERWIAKFERPRLKAISALKRRLERPDG